MCVTSTQITATFTIGATASLGSANVTVTTSGGTVGPISFTVTAGLLTLNCIPATGPTQVGSAYSATCNASGGTSPYTWSVGSGTLPRGISLGATSGASTTISGTPTTAGSYSYSIKVTDSTTPTAQTATQNYSGTILLLSPLTIRCLPLSGPTQVGVFYSAFCTADGGTLPYSWSIASGAPPAGVSFVNPAGMAQLIVGPDNAGGVRLFHQGHNNGTPAQAASQNYSGNITPATAAVSLSCSPTTGPTQVGVPYSATCTASGGTAPYSWSIGAGALPAGLALSAVTGSSVTISGPPSTPGPYTYTVRATDSTVETAQTASQSYSGNVLPVTAPLTLTCTRRRVRPRWVSHISHVYGRQRQGAVWLVDQRRLIAGGCGLERHHWSYRHHHREPYSARLYSYALRVSDSTTPTPQTATQSYSGSVQSSSLSLNCNPTTGPTQTTTSYFAACTVTGGAAPYSWSIAGGNLRRLGLERDRRHFRNDQRFAYGRRGLQLYGQSRGQHQPDSADGNPEL